MTRISSLFFATTLAILPISAFAQQNAATSTGATSNSTMTTAPTPAPVAGKTATGATADVTQPAKPVTKPVVHSTKSELHSTNTVAPHHAKSNVPAKTAEPAKS